MKKPSESLKIHPRRLAINRHINTSNKQLDEATRFLRKKFGRRQHSVMLILGSGMGESLNDIAEPIEVSCEQIPHFPIPTAQGHAGVLTSARFGKRFVLIMSGRPHMYEGYDGEDIAFPIRGAYLMGVRVLGVTNACGGLNPAFKEADLMVIKDHVNLMNTNALIGPHLERFGPRFPDMHEPYDKALIEALMSTAQEQNVPLLSGTFTAISGPSYETPAEMRFMRTAGIEATGMSTVQEVIVANSCTAEGRMRVFGISIITDICDPDNPRVLTHEEVLAIAKKAAPKLGKLLTAFMFNDALSAV